MHEHHRIFESPERGVKLNGVWQVCGECIVPGCDEPFQYRASGSASRAWSDTTAIFEGERVLLPHRVTGLAEERER